MERKTVQAFDIKIADADQGIVETVFAVMGNIDDGNDVLHPGAFTKTFTERGHKVRVLDAHQTDSIMRVLGKPLELRELNTGELPGDLKTRHPDANGAAWARVQFLMETPEGKGAFERIKAGAVDEWSFGYDALDKDYSKGIKDGKEVNVRNLRTVKLYELSPVLWGMNPATMTMSAKADVEPEDGKPWRAVHGSDGKWRVYKLDADGEPTGDALGTHDSEGLAQAQVRALYANEPKADTEPDEADTEPDEAKVKKTEQDGEHPASHYLVVEDPQSPSTWHLRVRNAAGEVDHRLMGAAWAALHGGYRGNRYEGPGKQEAIAKLTRLYASQDMETPKEITPEELEAIAVKVAEILQQKQQPAPGEEQAADDTDQPEQAGPSDETPTSMLEEVEALKRELTLMEVGR